MAWYTRGQGTWPSIEHTLLSKELAYPQPPRQSFSCKYACAQTHSVGPGFNRHQASRPPTGRGKAARLWFCIPVLVPLRGSYIKQRIPASTPYPMMPTAGQRLEGDQLAELCISNKLLVILTCDQMHTLAGMRRNHASSFLSSHGLEGSLDGSRRQRVGFKNNCSF